MKSNEKIRLITSLIRTAILNEESPVIPEDVDLDDLLKIAAKHEITSLIYTALANSNVSHTEQVKLLEKANLFLVLKDSLQKDYLRKIADCFEAHKISCTLLKGAIIKELYPCTHFRQSCDIDLFVDGDANKVCELMCGLGFEIIEFGNPNSHHDIYAIKPHLVVEVHNKLMRKTHSWSAEFHNMVERKVPYMDYKYIYQFTEEDFYVFMLAHMAKHLKFSGIGLKGITDIWVYKMKYANSFDMNILNDLLEKSGLKVFEKHITVLCKYLFEGQEPYEVTSKLAQLFFDNGAYGDVKVMSSRNLYSQKLKSKLMLYWNGFFVSRSALVKSYPVLKTHKWLLPVVWIIRGFKILFLEKNKISNYIDKTKKADVDYGKQVSDIIKEIGL